MSESELNRALAEPSRAGGDRAVRAASAAPVIRTAGVPVVLIDVDSEQSDALAVDDERLLERCAGLISPPWPAGDGEASATERVAG